jgi:acyl-CoA thioester hydrolase
VNEHLINAAGQSPLAADAIGVVVETMCRFAKPVSFPEVVEAGLRVEHLGSRSVRYGIGIFRQGDEVAAAHGHFVHVYVDRRTFKPVPIPAHIRAALEELVVG